MQTINKEAKAANGDKKAAENKANKAQNKQPAAATEQVPSDNDSPVSCSPVDISSSNKGQGPAGENL